MERNSPQTIELNQQQVDYLDQMVKRHNLVDRSKAVRILIAYAQENANEEDTIFEQIRCLYC